MRLLQIEFADAEEGERREYLSSEIAAALKEVLPEQRKAFLEELGTRFPTWDIRADATPEAAGTPELPPEINDWTFLLEHLVRVSPRLSDDERQKLAARLVEEGLVPESGEAEWPRATEKDLRKTLGIADSDPISPERVLRLLGLLAEFARSLERVVWLAWREMAPRSELRKSGDLQKGLGDYVTGKPDPTVKGDVEQLRKLVVGLTSAIRLSGDALAKEYLSRLAPEAIRQSARKPVMLENPAAPLWEKYEQLAKDLDRHEIVTRVLQLVAGNATEIITGLRDS